jgi:hypothetical protein
MRTNGAILNYTSGTSQNPFEDDFYKKIVSFSEIPSNYFYGNSPIINPDAIHSALRLHNECKNFKLKCNAFPGINGDIVFMVYKDETILEFDLYSSLDVRLIINENGEDGEFLENLDIIEAIKHISGLVNKTSCGLSESSAENIGIKTKAGSPPSHFMQVIPMVAYRSSPFLVSSKEGKQSVTILKRSILRSSEQGQYIGSSMVTI